MKKSLLILLLVFCGFAAAAQAEWLPAKSDRLVNDYSKILSDSERENLEKRLLRFNDSTSNQIVIVITPTLGGDDEDAVAQRIGQKWGVGQSDFNNGLVILLKSKTKDENWGAVAIATGYGLEGVLPDVVCKHIIDEEMLPSLREGDYYAAICHALDVIEPMARGEYDYEQYKSDKRSGSIMGLLIVFGFMAVVVILLIRLFKKIDKNSGGGGSGGYYGGHSSSYGGWRSSGSSGSSGGFGGFGGGSFGGGGASGRF